MRLLGGYLIREIALGIVFVLLGFLGLFAFFDLIGELDDVGKAGYRLQHALAYVALGLPSHVYELMPVAALIGCIYALAQFASNSEFTAMRAAGMSRVMALKSVIGLGVVLALLTAIAGEWVAPVAQQLGQNLRLTNLERTARGTFRSGLWIKDSRFDSEAGMRVNRFVNIGRLQPDGAVDRIEIYEFDEAFRLETVIRARNATYHRGRGVSAQASRSGAITAVRGGEAEAPGAEAAAPAEDPPPASDLDPGFRPGVHPALDSGGGSGSDSGTQSSSDPGPDPGRPAATGPPGAPATGPYWTLHDLERSDFVLAETPRGGETLRASYRTMTEMAWESELTPELLAVLTLDPDRMSAYALWTYVAHLQANGQNANRYEVALWKKIIYPVAIVVMLMLALPFGYIQARAGSVGLKLFTGIMIGVAFYFFNGLMSNLGLLNTWPPWVAVSIPSLVAFILALVMLARVGRTH